MSGESDATTEYRVMWWSEDHERWFPHTITPTESPRVAAAWLEQAIYRGPGGDRTEAFIEARPVTPWIRVISPVKSDEESA